MGLLFFKISVTYSESPDFISFLHRPLNKEFEGIDITASKLKLKSKFLCSPQINQSRQMRQASRVDGTNKNETPRW